MKFTSAFVVSMLLASSNAMKLQDDEPVVSPQAEKVSVLQTVIQPTRTTFYDKRNKLWRQAIVQRDDEEEIDHANVHVQDDNAVVSPEAEKVSVLQTPIGTTRTTFYDKINKLQNQVIAQLQEDPVVSPEAEKVSVLQTPIGATRTTFYNKKMNQKNQAIAEIQDDEPVVSPEAEKVSVLQTPIGATRTTFYDRKSAQKNQAIAEIQDDEAVVSPEAEKVSVLQTPIGATRTTFYDKKTKAKDQSIAQVEKESKFAFKPHNKPMDFNKRFNRQTFEGNLFSSPSAPAFSSNFLAASKPMEMYKPFEFSKPNNQVGPHPDAKKDIANKEVRPDVYQTVYKMVDPVPERRKQNPPKARTWDEGPKKIDDDDDSFLKRQIDMMRM